VEATRGRLRPRLSRTLSRARWDEYGRFLRSALEAGYSLVPLEAWVRGEAEGEGPVLILRHDVDQHPRSALAMAKIERGLGVRSSWYFRWRTADSRVVRALRRDGFEVGLHYETLTRLALERGLEDSPPESLLEEARLVLRGEISAFASLFGEIRSVVPHGDSRVPAIHNAALFEGQDPSDYGVEFDGNAVMRGRGLAYWLTDRSAAEGGWNEGVDPQKLIGDRVSPVLSVTHPNNWSSGPSLWLDRTVSGALPRRPVDPSRPRRPIRTGTDRPPEIRSDSFGAIADSLRERVGQFYAERGETLTGAAGLNTLETNAGFVERRAAPLLEILARRMGLHSIVGLRVLDLGCGFGALSVFFAAQGALVTGIDPNAERLWVGRAVAAEHGLSAEFHGGRMETLDLTDRSFDLVVQNNSLCYVIERSDRAAALLETHRVLRPGGVLIVRNPNRWHPRDQFSGLPLVQLLPPRQAVAAAELLGRERSLVRLNSPAEATRELRAAGFEAVEQVASPSSPWPAFAKVVARYQQFVAERGHPHGWRSGVDR
jgi:ubiquinone/menaquinone biosynthesis C-methylase UbiE